MTKLQREAAARKAAAKRAGARLDRYLGSRKLAKGQRW